MTRVLGVLAWGPPSRRSGVPLPIGKLTIRREDIGIIPLLLSFPFMFFPKVLAGDTQPWVLLCALAALFTFRRDQFVARSDIWILMIAMACIAVYVSRSESLADSVRAVYTQVAFVVFWLVASRERGEYFVGAIKLTIVVWLAIGIYQYFALLLGLPVEFVGRYVAGRSGIPSLTSEPSMYGSLSVVQMMYLLSHRRADRHGFYVACAATSVVLSGSLLALLLLSLVFLRLNRRLRVAISLAVPSLVIVDYAFTSAGLTSRLSDIFSQDAGVIGVFLDASLNLRIGHVYFTLVDNLWESLFLMEPLSFMAQYNAFASTSGVFIDTGSNFILPAAGELVYGSGVFGLLLLVLVFMRAQAGVGTLTRKLEKLAFISACMLNPISISNIYLIVYARQAD